MGPEPQELTREILDWCSIFVPPDTPLTEIHWPDDYTPSTKTNTKGRKGPPKTKKPNNDEDEEKELPVDVKQAIEDLFPLTGDKIIGLRRGNIISTSSADCPFLEFATVKPQFGLLTI